MPVVPVVYYKKVNITVSVSSIIGRQTLIHEVEVKYNGVTNRYHTPYFIDLINAGSVKAPDFDIPVPEMFVVSRIRSHIYVKGSARLKFGLIGKVKYP